MVRCVWGAMRAGERWRELFTRASFLTGLLIGQSNKQGD